MIREPLEGRCYRSKSVKLRSDELEFHQKVQRSKLRYLRPTDAVIGGGQCHDRHLNINPPTAAACSAYELLTLLYCVE